MRQGGCGGHVPKGPDGDEPAPESFGRRGFMQLLGASAALAGLCRLQASDGRLGQGEEVVDRVMAIVNFSGTLRIVQNFTSNIARLEKALQTNLGPGLVAGQEVIALRDTTGASAMSSAAMGAVALSNAEMEFRSATVLLALRSLANNLAQAPDNTSAAGGGIANTRDRYGKALTALMALAGVMLLIACINNASLLLAGE